MKIKENTLKKLFNFKAESIKMYFENLRKWFKNGPENLKNRGLEGVWELLGAILRRKTFQKLSWLILVNLGRARIDQNLAQRGQDGGKLEPS